MSNKLILLNQSTSYKPKTRDQIINVQSNFCNLRDADDIPIFTIYLTSLYANNNLDKFINWITRLKAAGSTHIDIGLTAKYDENLGWIDRYPISDIDLTNNLPLLQKIANVLINMNFIPHIHLSWDDNGFSWGMNNIPTIISELKPLIPYCLWNTGWDGCFPSWSRDQTITAIQLLRQCLGPNGQIATEFGGPGGLFPYIDMGQGQADYDGPLQQLDCLCLEYGNNGQIPIPDCGMQQQGTRILGKSYNLPLISGCDDHSNVYYLSSPRQRGPLNICIYEWVWGGAYSQIRKLSQPSDAATIAKQFKAYGYSSFGNGQPL